LHGIGLNKKREITSSILIDGESSRLDQDLITLFLEDSIPRHVLSMTSLTKLLELVGSNGGDDPWQEIDFTCAMEEVADHLHNA